MSGVSHPYVCPAEFAGSLDNSLRKLVHDPCKILSPFISKGMTVLDLGCGPGYFTLAISELAGDTGMVVAADIQQAMLEKVQKKIIKARSAPKIRLHKCDTDKLGIAEKIDFVLAFWIIHEVPDQERLFGELKSLLNRGGKIFIIEPKWHVTERSFNNMLDRTAKAGFEIVATPKVFFSRSVVLAEKQG
jgi:ubiquinone/menaquinone biosynthesis C-methylase UbiE